ncbi:hypothetical protein [Noviherbaspirillum pedocola]|uniref:Uncharacterized protein n=1 Tax=Noviherbaspirillum pedocola TaxID=2801341 RepID=A0A934T1W1_9BURK|nr:hypothetical protein [Noviherbaspirillum pedocola]MBK4737354.1 hypothetical protein [Noviherbaspirillum pedocola]
MIEPKQGNKSQSEESDQAVFARQCSVLLPDTAAALVQIVERYGWNEILAVNGIRPSHLNLLGMLSIGKKITFRLPNKADSTYEGNEFATTDSSVDHTVREPLDSHPAGADPTLLSAMVLMLGRYILINEGSEEDEKLTCELTEKGQALLHLNRQFAVAHSGACYQRNQLSKTAHRLLADLIYACISESEKPYLVNKKPLL